MIDVDAYCREVEAYLCRKNDGHLIRIVGPAFDVVIGWAQQGIPLRVAEAGIDRYFERYYRKGARRRPVRIEFCDADVLDAFDQWRRAVGIAVVRADVDGGPDVEEPTSAVHPTRSLAAHLESVVARLTALRGSDRAGGTMGEALDTAVRSIDELRPRAAKARGDAREAIIDRLVSIDRELVDAALRTLDRVTLDRLQHEAERDLETFRSRMPAVEFERVRHTARDRLVRHHVGLPDVEY